MTHCIVIGVIIPSPHLEVGEKTSRRGVPRCVCMKDLGYNKGGSHVVLREFLR